MDTDDSKCHPDVEEGSRPTKSEARMADAERTIHRFHRFHRLSPEPNPILASPRAAFAGGCLELGDLRTEATKRNNVAKATILHACSTENTERVKPESGPDPQNLCALCGSMSDSGPTQLP
jgi:hypothetical protein